MVAGPKIALLYSDSGYKETTTSSQGRGHTRPLGLMGREVAGKEFLDAFLTHGTWDELVALADDAPSLESIKQTCFQHPASKAKKRRLQSVLTSDFQATFCETPISHLIHFPCPADAKFTWARSHAQNNTFALCGVTHTLCSLATVNGLQNLVTAPFESYDRLICTSSAVLHMAETVIESYCDYLRDRFGGEPRNRTPLELVPLGVNCEQFKPPQQDERRDARIQFEIRDEEIVVLFVGRFSHHAKANPFPMFRALDEAAYTSGKAIHLLMSGWSANAEIMKAFQDGATKFAPHIRCSFVDGTQPENRFRVWQAADVFMSLSDNIQETFGLVISEAMASGLPVIASDWNGYRDMVLHGQTGFLVETSAPQNSGADLTSQLITGQINYDHFLARSVQHVTVSVESATNAVLHLLENESTRKQMGDLGRQRALNLFSWEHVIRKYEQIWQAQLRERQSFAEQRPKSADKNASKSNAVRPTSPLGPSMYPSMSHSFESYPSRWLDAETLVRSNSTWPDELPRLLAHGLSSFEASARCVDRTLLDRLLVHASNKNCKLCDLLAILEEGQIQNTKAISTVAWLLKYDLVRIPLIDNPDQPTQI